MRNGVHYHQAYNAGQYPEQAYRQKPGYGRSQAMVSIGRDNNVTWQGPVTGNLYVQVDNEPLKLFASGISGTQAAPWIQQGHVYTFILQDTNGNELARDQVDLRSNPNSNRRYNR